MPLTSQELQSKLWQAADILRGQIDSADYKSYIFSMLFLKRLSDRFDEEVANAVTAGVSRAAAVSDPDEHQFAVPETAHWSQMRQVDDQRLGRGVDGSATAVAMCQSRRAAFTVGRQDAAGVAGSYSHQLGCLVQGHVLCCQAVEHMKSALFFWGQCHILHDVTLSLTS